MKAVIFDLDGVLIDTGRYHHQAWQELARREGFDMPDDFFVQTFGMQNYQIMPLLAGHELSRKEIDRMADWKENRYRELIDGRAKLLPGVTELVADLKSARFALAVGSSTPRANIDFLLKQLGVENKFQACVAGEDVRNGKPAPDTFLAAAAALAVPPGCCAVVEDAVAGVQAARAAGMAVVAVTTTRKRADLHQADIVVDSLAELKAADFTAIIGSRPDRG